MQNAKPIEVTIDTTDSMERLAALRAELEAVIALSERLAVLLDRLRAAPTVPGPVTKP